VKYKVSGVRQQGIDSPDDWDVVFPNSWTDVSRKLKDDGPLKIADFNPSAAV
jgi:hypothetical protein